MNKEENGLFPLEDSDQIQIVALEEVDSTNNFLRDYRSPSPRPITLVTAENQTAGRGQRGNSWESEPGRNLVFSLLIHPQSPVNRIFSLSEVCALAIRDALSDYVPGVLVKWPNDIYYGEKKMAGILIETTLSGKMVEDCIIGVGININQKVFRSDAPNPCSLCQLLGKDVVRKEVLQRVMGHFIGYLKQFQQGDAESIHARYMKHLYRGGGMHPFHDEYGDFVACIVGVEPSGYLLLKDEDGQIRRYAFKEVAFGGTRG